MHSPSFHDHVRAWATLAVGLAAALILACGGDEEPDYSGDNRGGPASAAEQTVTVTAKDFSFAPAKLTASAGNGIELTLTNAGNVPHTFTIDELDVDADVAAGEETTVSISSSDPGDYPFFCRFHTEEAMQGTMTITADGGVSGGGDPTEPPADDSYYGY